MRPVLVRLGREHRQALDAFECDAHELVVYLRRWALRHQERDRLGRTWLAITQEDAEPRVAGYLSLAVASVERSLLVGVGELDRLPRFPVPAVLLARLAVDSRVQGQGLGRWLFEEALATTLRLATEGPVGIRLLVTDAKDARAERFYEGRGMVGLGPAGVWPRRMVLDLAQLTPRPAPR